MYHYAGNNPVNYTDPDGRSDKKGPNLNYFPKCESIYKWSEKEIRPVNSFVIAAHGNPNGIYRYPNPCIDESGNVSRGKSEFISPDELALIIKSSPEYKKGMTVILWSCNTGKELKNGKKNYAQKLADALGPGSKVKAPTKLMWFFPNKQKQIADKKIDLYNGKKIEIPDDQKPGKLKTFVGEKNETN